jgi:hypothetical protein
LVEREQGARVLVLVCLPPSCVTHSIIHPDPSSVSLTSR